MSRRSVIGGVLGYGALVLLGLGIAASPFIAAVVTGAGLSVAAAASMIAKFVALPVAKVIFGALYEAVGPWAGLAIVASLPLAVTAVVHAVTATFSAIGRALSSHNHQPNLHPSTIGGFEHTVQPDLTQGLVQEPKVAVTPNKDTTPLVQDFNEQPDFASSMTLQ